MNRVFCGDCLDVMRGLKSNSVDLIYLDPPFASNRDYVEFNDKWEWDKSAEERARQIRTGYRRFISGMRMIIGFGPELSYLSYMTERIAECWRVLKTSGSIYLHCDPNALHYLQLLMDVVFGNGHFKNVLVWQRDKNGKGILPKTHYARKHDTILFYSGKFSTFNKLFIALSDKQKAQYRYVDKGGRRYLVYGHSDKRYYLDEAQGKLCDVWTDIDGFGAASRSNERTGYPTQKPRALLDRIICASSNRGDTVLDPFCGSGTTLCSAKKNDRQYIGIDINENAVAIARKRLGV